MTYYRVDEESDHKMVLEEIAVEGDYKPLERYTAFSKRGHEQTKKNDRAFPTFDHDDERYEMGITKREFFAAAALQGLLANPEIMQTLAPAMAVQQADKLIEILNQTSTNGA